jgi:hypothetical protein
MIIIIHILYMHALVDNSEIKVVKILTVSIFFPVQIECFLDQTYYLENMIMQVH